MHAIFVRRVGLASKNDLIDDRLINKAMVEIVLESCHSVQIFVQYAVGNYDALNQKNHWTFFDSFIPPTWFCSFLRRSDRPTVRHKYCLNTNKGTIFLLSKYHSSRQTDRCRDVWNARESWKTISTHGNFCLSPRIKAKTFSPKSLQTFLSLVWKTSRYVKLTEYVNPTNSGVSR